ncbi:MAG: YbjN domain-containing protein [Mycobacterium leprae]
MGLFDTVVEFFQTDEWHFNRLGEQTVLAMSFAGETGTWNCYAEVREEQQALIFFSVCPVKVPEHKRMDLAEFLTRANYGLIVGNFEMDFRDGEIRYKTSVRTGEETLPLTLIRNLVYGNVAMMDRYLPGIMTVMYGGASPAQVIAEIEG